MISYGIIAIEPVEEILRIFNNQFPDILVIDIIAFHILATIFYIIFFLVPSILSLRISLRFFYFIFLYIYKDSIFRSNLYISE